MTVQEAKIIVEGFLGDDETINEAIDMATESMEKQVAKKPILWQGKKHLCPNCHRDVVQTEALDVHCKYCGQALKWSEEDECS